jgi:predicted dehydrogenase
MTVLVVGCGSIGLRHARNLRAQGVELLVVDADHRRAEICAKEVDAKVCGSLPEALALQPAAAFICTPSRLHLSAAMQAIQAGCDVFVEKPITDEMAGVADLAAAADAAGRIVMVGYNLRFHPVLEQARRWFMEGRIGHVVSARLHVAEYLPGRHPGEDYRQTYAAQKRLGGGVILDAIHEIDYCIWFFGMPQTVSCVCGKFSAMEMDVEDTAEILLSYDRMVVSINLNYLQRPRRRWCELVGTEGTIACDLVAGSARLYQPSATEPELFAPAFRFDELYVREAEHFLTCVQERRDPVVDVEIGAQSLLIAECAKEASRSGRSMIPSSETVFKFANV